MACPTKRKGSDNWYYRRKIPADVRAILDKFPKTQRPKSWFKTDIVISLGTADREKAKAKCPEVAAEVEKRIEALRAGPKALSHKQVSALSGELYRGITGALEDNPVASAAQWLRVAEVNEAARRGEFGAVAILGIHNSPAEKRMAALEARFGKLTDAFLSGRGTILTDGSRWALIERLAVDLSYGARKLAKNADGDYSPDEYAKRFPEFEPTRQSVAKGQSLTTLVKSWHTAALARGVRGRDATRIKQRFEWLIAFLKHDDPGRVTREDIVRWGDHRTEEGRSAKTINDSDIAAFNNVFNWAVDRGIIASNPAKGVKVRGIKKPAVRDKYFRPEEIKAILKAATAVSRSKKEDPKTTAAKKWVPWLCAYSGSRVVEAIQIRKQDLREEPSGWVLRLTPDAGGIKNNQFRDVPIHQHLVDEGFIRFVLSARGGHLFCNPNKDGSIDGPAAGVYRRVTKFVRAIVPDPAVQPNHAWRYTFKTVGVEAGIPPLVLDAICGHAPKTQGDVYSKVTLKTRVDAIAKFPRYEVS